MTKLAATFFASLLLVGCDRGGTSGTDGAAKPTTRPILAAPVAAPTPPGNTIPYTIGARLLDLGSGMKGDPIGYGIELRLIFSTITGSTLKQYADNPEIIADVRRELEYYVSLNGRNYPDIGIGANAFSRDGGVIDGAAFIYDLDRKVIRNVSFRHAAGN